MKEDVDATGVVDAFVQQEGRMTVTTKDGTLFLFSVQMLERLLEAARNSGSGRAVVLVKNEVRS